MQFFYPVFFADLNHLNPLVIMRMHGEIAEIQTNYDSTGMRVTTYLSESNQRRTKTRWKLSRLLFHR